MDIIESIEERDWSDHKWLAAVLESIADAVVATDAGCAISRMNAAAERLTGWTNGEARSKPADEVLVIRRRTGEPVECPFARVLRGETFGADDALPSDAMLVRRDGTTICIADSVALIREPSGTLSGAVMVFRDVTARVRELERLAFLSRASSELNASLDYEVTLSTVAKLAVPMIADGCAVITVKDGEVSTRAVAHVSPEKAELIREYFNPTMRNECTLALNNNSDSKLIPEMTDASPAELDEDCLALRNKLDFRSYISVPLQCCAKGIGAIKLISGESGRRFDASDLEVANALAERAAIAAENARLFEELSTARAEADSRRLEAELANRAKDEFLAVLGHELRNPLAPIAMSLDLMRLTSGDSPARNIADRQVKHLTRLVDDLLDVSRITRSKFELTMKPIDIAEVIANGIDLATPLLEGNRHQLSVYIEPGTWVDGDDVRLAQVISNLLNNAAKYSDPGEPISIRAGRQNGEVVLAVRDEGIGIDASILPRIFEPFVQQLQGLDRAAGGLGLGLAIVRGIVTLHGGTVSAHSDGPGRGAEIVVRLPARQQPGSKVVDSARDWPACHSPVRVLLVDDNVDALMLLVELLRNLGYDPVYADDPLSALELADSTKPAIALVDIGMPRMDGYELARRLREVNGLADIKLVAITGYGLESYRARSTVAGFNHHMVKPVSLDKLHATLEMLAGGSQEMK